MADFLPAFALVLAPMLLFERDWHANKHAYTISARYPDAMKKLLSLRAAAPSAEREKLVVDNWSCSAYRYYVRYNPSFSKVYGQKLRQSFELDCVNNRATGVFNAVRRALRNSPRAWLLATSNRVVTAAERQWPEDLDELMFARIGADHIVAAIGPKRSEPAPPPEPEPQAEPETESEEN
jgi:hypothetical protein